MDRTCSRFQSRAPVPVFSPVIFFAGFLGCCHLWLLLVQLKNKVIPVVSGVSYFVCSVMFRSTVVALAFDKV